VEAKKAYLNALKYDQDN
jgi:N-alpha-acetyltransferase 15/16, NatA auxiliary subunit